VPSVHQQDLLHPTHVERETHGHPPRVRSVLLAEMAAIMWGFSQTTLIVTDVPAGSPWTRTEGSPPRRSGAGNSKRPELVIGRMRRS